MPPPVRYTVGSVWGRKEIVEKPNYRGWHGVTGQYIAKVKASARKRGLVYDVTAEYLWNVWLEQDGKCVYTGRNLTHSVDASLDRIDSDKGYVEGNVQWLHKDINKIKWEFSETKFLAICREIVAHTEREMP